jgi:hypothetical protein
MNEQRPMPPIAIGELFTVSELGQAAVSNCSAAEVREPLLSTTLWTS